MEKRQSRMLKLSICIPTYNRAIYLKQCLQYLFPQVKNLSSVEVVISDNASTDETALIVKEYIGENIKYFRNSRNFGYAGNQIECIKHAQGNYLAILCDDDIYTHGLVQKILEVIKKNEYAFIALNYYSFRENVDKPHLINFAPEKDVIFQRAYDIMNYPSVGHFSGFIFNTKLAKEMLPKILIVHPLTYYEKHRGIISSIVVRLTLGTNLPSFFIGERKLATRDPQTVDYNVLKNGCLDYYEFYEEFYSEGLITRKDLEYRKKLVLSWIPFAIAKDSYVFTDREIAVMRRTFFKYFKRELKFILYIYPLLLLASFWPIRRFYRLIFDLKQILRHIKKRFFS